MALSNIFREPRREITETIVGLILIVPGLCLWGWLTIDIYEEIPGTVSLSQAAIIGFCLTTLIVVALGLLGFIVVCIHGLGNIACTALEARGIQMRPRNRP